MPDQNAEPTAAADPSPTSGLDAGLEDLVSSSASNDASSGDDFVSSILSDISTSEAEPEPPTKAADPTPTDSFDDGFAETPKGVATPEAKAKWGELRSELKQEREKVASLEETYKAKVSELEARIADLAEVESKAKLVDELDRELSVAKIESSLEYKRVVADPLEAIGTAAEELAKANEIDKDALLDALSERDRAKRNRALEPLLAGMNDLDKSEVLQMLRDTQSLLDKHDQMVAHAKDAKAELDVINKAQSEKSKAEFRKNLEAGVTDVVQSFKERIPFMALTDGETVDAVMEHIKTQSLDANFDTANPKVQAYAIAAGVLLPRLVKQYRAVEAAKKAAEDRVAKLTSGGPTGASSQRAASAARATDDFVSGVLGELGVN